MASRSKLQCAIVPVFISLELFQVNCLVAGTGCAAVAKEVAAVAGVTKVKLDLELSRKPEENLNIQKIYLPPCRFCIIIIFFSQVLLADSPAFTGFLPEHLTPLLVSTQNQFKYTHIIAVS